MRGKLIRISLIVLGIIITLIALVVLILTSAPGENYLKAQLTSRLGEAIGKKIELASLSTNIISDIELRDVAVIDTAQKQTSPILEIHELKVNYNLLELLSRKVMINSVIINGIDFDIVRDSLGNLNIINPKKPATTTPARSSSSFKIIVASIKIDNISGNYDDKPLNLDSRISDLKLNARLIGETTYDFSLTLDSININYDSLEISGGPAKADGDFDYGNHLVILDSLSLASSGLDLSASGQIPLEPDSSINAELQLSGSMRELWHRLGARYALPPAIKPDSLRLAAAISGTMTNPDAKADIDLPSIEIENTSVNDLKLTAAYHDDTLSLDTLTALVYDGSIDGRGQVEFDGLRKIRAGLTVHDINIADLFGSLYNEKSKYQGVVNGHLIVKGSLDSLTGLNIDGNFRSSRAQYDSRPVPNFYADISLARGIGHVDIHQEQFKIIADATFNDHRIDASFTADIANLRPLAGLLNIAGLAGSLKASGNVNGPFDSLTIEASGQGKNIVYGNFPVDTLDAQILYAQNRLDIKHLTFAGSIESIDTTSPPFGLESLRGKYDYRGRAAGVIDSLSGQVVINSTSPVYQSYRADSLKLSADLNNGRIDLTAASIFKSPIELKLSGNYDISQQAGSLTVDLSAPDSKSFTSADGGNTSKLGTITSAFDFSRADNYDITLAGRHVDLLTQQYIFPDTLAIAGWADFDGKFGGNFNSPDIELSATIISPAYDQARFDSLYAVASLRHDSLDIDTLNIFANDRSIVISSRIGLQKDSTGGYTIDQSSLLSGRARASAFDLGPLQSFWVSGSDISGRATFDIAWHGRLGSPRLAGQLQVDSARAILYPGAQPIDSISIEASLADSALTIDYANCFILGRHLTITGTAIATPWTQLDMDITCRLDKIGTVNGKGHLASDSLAFTAQVEQLNLAVLQPFIETIKDIGGTLNSRLTISGKLDNPDIIGNLELDSLTFRPAYVENKFNQGLVRISFNHHNINLDSLYVRSDSGLVTASGNVIYGQGKVTDVDLHAGIDKLKLDGPRIFSLYLKSADLSYKSKNDRFLLDGDLYLGNFHFTMDFKYESLLPWAQSVETLQPQLPGFLQRTDFNVRLRESDSLWVDNNLAHLQLLAALTLIGTPVQPNMTGRIAVVKGYFLYLDRKFKLLQGDLYFSNAYKLNPDINIQSQTMVTSYQGLQGTTDTISFDISGTLEKPVVKLYSNPPLSQPDIISLLTVGATREQLTGKAGTTGELTPQQRLLERAGLLGAEQLSRYFSQAFGSSLGLQSISVQSNLFQFNRNWGPALVVTKKLSNRLELTFNTTVGRLNNQSVTLDYLLTRHISLQGQTDRQGEANIDLNYGLKFR